MRDPSSGGNKEGIGIPLGVSEKAGGGGPEPWNMIACVSWGWGARGMTDFVCGAMAVVPGAGKGVWKDVGPTGTQTWVKSDASLRFSLIVVFKNRVTWSSCCGAVGSVACLQHQVTRLIPAQHSELKDLALPKLWCSSQMVTQIWSLAQALHMPRGSQKVFQCNMPKNQCNMPH